MDIGRLLEYDLNVIIFVERYRRSKYAERNPCMRQDEVKSTLLKSANNISAVFMSGDK